MKGKVRVVVRWSVFLESKKKEKALPTLNNKETVLPWLAIAWQKAREDSDSLIVVVVVMCQ